VAIDGKTSRGSHDRGKGRAALHLVSAFATREKLVLAQEAVADGACEQTTIPLLLERLAQAASLKGALVSIDAVACNATTAQAILDAGADYLLVVKANQPGLPAEIETFFADPLADVATTTEVDKAHRTASSLAVEKGGRGRLIGRTKGGLNSKLHVLADAKGRPISMFLSAGQTSDYVGARVLLPAVPETGTLLADRGYDANWFRNALIDRGISPCIPSRACRKEPIPHDTALYRLRHRIENSFARLKDWRRIATRYDRCPILFLSACVLAAIVMFWL